jgi:hypothetical protein
MSAEITMTEDERKRALDATIAEYEDLRDEIKRRIDQRTHITELMITIDGTLAGLAVYTGNWFILGILPLVSAFCLLNIKASYIIHRRLTQYISEVIERQKLPLIFDKSKRLWLSWETFYRERLADPDRQRGTRRPMFDVFELALFTFCSIAVIIYSFVQFDWSIAIAISAAYTILGAKAVEAARMIDPYKVDSSISHDWQSLGER